MKKKILLVEDQAVIRNLLAFLLKQEGLIVETAENGLVAIEKLRNNGVDYSLIILDIDMPYMNGWEFCEAYQTLPRHGEPVPLVVNSSDRIIGRLEMQKKYGILFFADKANPMELVTEVTYLLGMGHDEYLQKVS